MEKYSSQAEELFEYTRTLRRDFHMHPELGFQEFRTSGIVAGELENLGIPVTTGIGKTGIVGLIHFKQPGPTALLRFDMDALPIQEETAAPYASVNPGVMHACGHDGHTAIGLTVAKLLLSNQENLAGTVKLVFQPAEEGLGGAQAMVADGVLENPKPDFSLALHLWNDKPYGWIGITEGPAMAASETFTLHLTGKGGHGASPHMTIDPVLTTAHLITALQSIVSRNVDPLKTAVVSATSISGGDAFNVIPQDITVKGTIRTFDPKVRAIVLDRFNQIATGVAESMGCQIEIEIKSITPAVINDPRITRSVLDTTSKYFGEYTINRNEITMGSEDMAYMMDDIPGCYIFIGSNNPEKGLDAPHHNPRFDVDERSLPLGAALITAAVTELLTEK
jgi:amidohydrolase